MRNEILELVPDTVNAVLQKESEVDKKSFINLIADEAAAYGFEPEQVVPCIMAAYYVYESTAFPDEMEDEWKLSLVFHAAIRSAMKLLSYGKYKAVRSENGWMRYTTS